MPPPRNETPRRKNGFSYPYTGAQISTWFALPTLIVEFVLVVAPVLPLEAAIPCTIVFGLTATLAAYYAAMAQMIDPMDDYLAKHLKRKESGEPEEDNGFAGCLGAPGDACEPLKHCWICETQVAEHAMHCKFCNKCVGKFDHHCMWLNTCVGKANYHYFLMTMIFITAMLIVHSSIQVALIIDIFLGGSSQDRADEWFDTNSHKVLVGIYIGFVVFDAVALSLLLQLLHFHWILSKEGLTTYRYIVRETQRKRERTNKEEARKNQRMVAMGKANDEGNTLLALRLRYGESCKCCDPLPPMEEEKKEEERSYTPVNQRSSNGDHGDTNGNGEHANGEGDGVTFVNASATKDA
ncbi:Zinc finger, DHHC-type containing [Seminavis robusta]|uniref:Palmitoyltransferase n=1 Tax=Seminavis robusta TaxID=568900 RepID=A0A9N8DRH1_9STRA|nr:Zinc finger, DHHC-type containing [Seminavis robusta]|eukprot:Sro287_g108660.1 Zinc finger, DHHC-type containing (352) ;mRNA; f:59280-60532